MGIATGNPRLGQPVILLVDDDARHLRAMRRMMAGVDVHLASGGYEAIELLREGLKPGLVLSDIRMADGSGVTLMRWMIDERPSLLDRLVFITGLGPEVTHWVKSHETVFKPLSEENIKDFVRRAEEMAG